MIQAESKETLIKTINRNLTHCCERYNHKIFTVIHLYHKLTRGMSCVGGRVDSKSRDIPVLLCFDWFKTS